MSERWQEDQWSTDERPIVAARLSAYPYGAPPFEGTFLAIDGWEFKRIFREGEMAAIPFLRMTKGEVVIETSLRSFDWVEFKAS
jgi:hypothetical protein